MKSVLKHLPLWTQLGREHHTARNTAWLMAGQVLSVLCQAIYFLCLGRLLGSIEYGIFAGVFAFTAIAAQYSSLGMGTVFIRYVSRCPENVRLYWGNILLTTAVVGTLLTVSLKLIGLTVLSPSSAKLIVVSAVANCICTQLALECSKIFQCFGRMNVCAFLQLTMNATKAILAVVALICLHHASAWVWAMYVLAVSAAVASLSILLVLKFVGRPVIQLGLFRDRAMEGLGYAFATSSSVIYNDLDKAMLGHYGLNLANGVYTMAYRVIDVVTIPLYSLRDALLPELFREGKEQIGSAAGRTLRMLRRIIPIGIACSGLLLFVAPFPGKLLGPGFQETGEAIRWLCAIPILRSIHIMTGNALTGSGHQGRRTIAQLTAAGLNLCLNLKLIQSMGWRGAALSSVITDGVLAVLCWAILDYTRRKGHSSLVNSNATAAGGYPRARPCAEVQ